MYTSFFLPFCDFVLRVPANELIFRNLRKGGLVQNAVELGQNLKNRRLSLGRTQKQAARKSGVLLEVYDRWERDERESVVSVWPFILAFLGYYPNSDAQVNLTLMARRYAGLGQKAIAKKVGAIHQRLRDWERE